MNPYTPQYDLHFSTTEGDDWEQIRFSSDLISVDAILTEPGELTQIVTIFGHVSWIKPWQIFTVNLTTLAKSCSTADYEDWTYADCNESSEAAANIGMELKFTRRKSDSKCYNGEDFKRKVFNQSCPDCKMSDYFCQSGWKVTEDNRCKNNDQSSDADAPYTIGKSNIRPIKAPGNTCMNEFNWSRPKDNRPVKSQSTLLNVKIANSTSTRFAM